MAKGPNDENDTSTTQPRSQAGTGSIEDQPKRIEEASKFRSGAPLAPVAKPRGRVISEGEEVTMEGQDDGQYVTMTEDVWEEYYPANTAQPSYRLLYAKNSSVARSQLERRNQRQATDGAKNTAK